MRYDSDEEFNKKLILEETLTVGELIAELQKYPSDMKVCTTWESTKHSLIHSNIYYSYWDCLFIDADENFYRDRYIQNGR